MWVLFWFSFVWLKKSFHYFIYIYIYKYIKIKLLFFFERFYPNTKRFKRTLIYFNTDTVYKFSWKSPLSSYKMILEQQIKWLKTMKMKKNIKKSKHQTSCKNSTKTRYVFYLNFSSFLTFICCLRVVLWLDEGISLNIFAYVCVYGVRIKINYNRTNLM